MFCQTEPYCTLDSAVSVETVVKIVINVRLISLQDIHSHHICSLKYSSPLPICKAFLKVAIIGKMKPQSKHGWFREMQPLLTVTFLLLPLLLLLLLLVLLVLLLLLLWYNSLQWAGASSLSRFIITFRHTTLSRTPLDEESAHHGGIEPAIPASERADPYLRLHGHLDRLTLPQSGVIAYSFTSLSQTSCTGRCRECSFTTLSM